MVAILWQVGVFDSLYYHQQNIRWNEEYGIVPGLGNIEHRFGFNSNYLLLSPVFGFRFLFGETVYALQVLVLVSVMCWIIKEVITSGYEIKRIALLLVFTSYIFTFGYTLTASSTDSIPNVIAFYLIAKLLLYPETLKTKYLFLFFVPVSLLTFKISIAPICLISLIILISLLRQKNISVIVSLISVSVLITGLWLARNVIITGYLIFPLHEIDVFAVDWKIPVSIAIEEKDFIYSCGIRSFGDMTWRIKNWEWTAYAITEWFTYFSFFSAIILLPVITLYSTVVKKYVNKTAYLIFLILALILILWYTGGPDPRFIGGVLFATIYYIIFVVLSTREEKHFRRIGIAALTLFTCMMGYWAISRTKNFTAMYNIQAHPKSPSVRTAYDVLIKQYPYKESLKSMGFFVDDFKPYTFDNGSVIYISRSPQIPLGQLFVCFESPFPCTVRKDDKNSKYLDVSEIETRGLSLQDGFRVK
jgi:hypothetical protein